MSSKVKHKAVEIGAIYGSWEVLSKAARDKSGLRMWTCKCKCGTIKSVHGSSLRYGHSSSCGCIKSIIGNKYGSLTVTAVAEGSPKSYICSCDCGGSRVCLRGQLTNGSNRSCKNCKSKKHMNRKDKLAYTRLLCRVKGTYNLEEEELRDLMDKQSGCCAICADTLKVGRGKYHIDHDHKTGRVRGLLCGSCNVGLGMFRDSPTNLHYAIVYLDES